MGIHLGRHPLTALIQDTEELINTLKEDEVKHREYANRKLRFVHLALLLADKPNKELTKGEYGDCLLSFFMPVLRNVPEIYRKLPITSSRHPMRKRVLREIHSLFLKTEDFAVLQRISDNSEKLIIHFDIAPFAMQTFLTENQRRYQFMMRCLADRHFLDSVLAKFRTLLIAMMQTNPELPRQDRQSFEDLFTI